MSVYERFIEEVDALTIRADEPVARVVGVLTRAVKRAQMTVDGEIRPVAERPANPAALGTTSVREFTPAPAAAPVPEDPQDA